MTDQTESEYAVLLRNIDFAAAEFDGHPGIYQECAAAIRALEAKAEAWKHDALRYAQNADFWRADCERLAGKVERLQQAIKRQAASARMGMDAATRIGASNVREAARLFAESQPAVIESQRAANELLTDEVARLTSELSALRAERSTMDCRYAGQYWEASGSHCPIDKPCVRCERDRLREAYDILECNLANDGVLSLSEKVARLTAELEAAREIVHAAREVDEDPAGISGFVVLRAAIDAARSAGGEG